jgi:4-alpha-glucanotransferase
MEGPGFLVPLRNADLFRWCLEHGLHAVQVMTLMTVGFYQEPSGPYMPSILY